MNTTLLEADLARAQHADSGNNVNTEFRIIVDGTTTTTTIDEHWPNGWTPAVASLLEDASLLAAAAGETMGLHRTSTSSLDGESQGLPSPFSTLNRRYP